MHIGPYIFKPRLFMSIGFLALFTSMIALAIWQLRRADEKIAILSAAESAMAAPAVALESLVTDKGSSLAVAAEAYRRVRLAGCYDDVRQFLWDNRSHAGSPGFEAITPLRLRSGKLALVNRGWLPLGQTRQDLPDLSFAGAGPDDDCMPVDLEGLFTRPSKGLMSGPAMAPPTTWPRIIQFFDYEMIAAALGEPIVPGVVQLQQASAPSSRPEALAANWQPAASGPEKHYGYAFQWFAMATALTVIYIVLNTVNTRRPASDTDPAPHD